MSHVYHDSAVEECGIAICFAKPQPLVLELGCGRGEATVAMARSDPDRHYLGIDLKGARLHRGAEAAGQQQLGNVAFVVISIKDLGRLVPEGGCHEAWMFFPDPFAKRRKTKHRMTSPDYLRVYRQIMAPGALLHLKTDVSDLFEYSLTTLEREGCVIHRAATNLAEDECDPFPLAVRSDYELRFRAEHRPIYYICFSVS
jgi:tRNA (guanine-N7-)-methyltransferase